ncbi:MAG: DNA polymerase III subunit delta [Actinomycetota bacterium]|nr:DNA polymerase III subunit delta [Actinomycetota bacterium]
MSVPAYLLQGEPFLVDEALDRVRGEVGGDAFSEMVFDATTSGAEIVTALRTSSLLGGRRVVIVRDADALKKEQVDALLAYLESPSPDAVLVLIAEGRTKFDAVLRRTGGSVALEAPRGRRLTAWIKQRGREHGVRVDDRAATALTDAVGGELRDLDGALSQLATALGGDARVTVEDVRRAFPRYAEERTYVLTDAVGERKLPAAMTALRRLLQQGDDPLMVFGAVSAHVRRMLRVRRAAEQSAAAVGELSGLPAWRAERLQRQARAYNEDELVSALAVLASTDVEMKGGDLTPEAALERAVLQIVGGQGGGI